MYRFRAQVVVGCIIGLCYGWKLSLVAIGMSFFSYCLLVGGLTHIQLAFLSSCAGVMSNLYVVCLSLDMSLILNPFSAWSCSRINSTRSCTRIQPRFDNPFNRQDCGLTVSQVACEAAASIRTVASLVREDDCARIYSESLEKPLKTSNRTMVYRVFLLAVTLAAAFWVIALVCGCFVFTSVVTEFRFQIFWYGSRLVASLDYTITQFFVVVMACHAFFLSFLAATHLLSRLERHLQCPSGW